MMRMVIVLTLVAALSLNERTAWAAQPWFQINIYGQNTYTSVQALDIDGLSYGHAGTSYFGAKGATGLVVKTEAIGGTLTSKNLNNAQGTYSWQSFVKPKTTWALSPQPMPGMRMPDHHFTIEYMGTQYGTTVAHTVIP